MFTYLYFQFSLWYLKRFHKGLFYVYDISNVRNLLQPVNSAFAIHEQQRGLFGGCFSTIMIKNSGSCCI